MTAKAIWLDGEMVAWENATVHLGTHGLHYGIGFFEGVRSHDTPSGPAVFRLTDHLRRLERSAAVYGVRLPYSLADLREACLETVRVNGLRDCYLRPLVFLGEGANPLAAPFRVAVLAMADGPLVGASPDRARTARISSFQRPSANALPPAAKACGQYLNAFVAQTDARSAGADEAILLNAEGYVTDGWAHNVFTVRDGVLRTPPCSAGALEGITRDSVLRLADELGFRAAEENLVRSDLYLADEMFLTGTSAGVVAVSAVDGRPVGTGAAGAVTTAVATLLRDITTGADRRHPEWLEYV
jgi:branched-chain amino acid aminotransferase